MNEFFGLSLTRQQLSVKFLRQEEQGESNVFIDGDINNLSDFDQVVKELTKRVEDLRIFVKTIEVRNFQRTRRRYQ